MTVLTSPVNQMSEVLYELITRDNITRMEFFQSTGILNVTARIANLRIKHDLDIVCKDINIRNKHGRVVTYGQWSLPDKEKGKEVYLQINIKR